MSAPHPSPAALFLLGFLVTLTACAGGAQTGVDHLDGRVVATPEGAQLRVQVLLSDLDEPWGMDFLPDGRLLVTEKSGGLKLIAPTTREVQDIGPLPDSVDTGQGGLMDVLVHPRFHANQFVYLSYTVAVELGTTTQVARARLEAGQLRELQVLFTAEPGYSQRRHYGSRLHVDDRGYLFITVGDRGNRDRAQSLATHNGKVLRLHDDGRIPIDNPFVNDPEALPEIWTYGHRNPQGMAQHPVDGSLWVSEHGPQGGDEINRLQRGANYGWPVITYGEEYGGGKIGLGTEREGMEQPLVYWVPSIGTAGIAFYTGDRYPGWQPSLLVAGLRDAHIERVELVDDGLGERRRIMGELNRRVRDVAIGADGLVYALIGGDSLVRLLPGGSE